MAAFVASVFGGQPLLISGVTGPITVFNKTIFEIFRGRSDGYDYLHFMGWVYLWAAILHWVTAILNSESCHSKPPAPLASVHFALLTRSRQGAQVRHSLLV